MIFDFAVIGGGAAGLSAAISFHNSEPQKTVIILERLDRIGKKILATGNGRCKLSNIDISLEKYTSTSPAILVKMISKMPTSATLDFFSQLGLFCRADVDGRIYPYCNQASVVLDVMRSYILEANIPVLCSVNISSLSKAPNCFTIYIENQEAIYAKSVLISTGGCATPNLGSNGSGFSYSRMFQHSTIPLYPCLVPIESNTIDKSVKGVRTHCKVSMYKGNTRIFDDIGEVQFIEGGISGIPIFQLSRFFETPSKSNEYTIFMDFFPEITLEALRQELTIRWKRGYDKLLINFLAGMLNNRLALFLLKHLCSLSQRHARISDLSESDILFITKGLKQFPIFPSRHLAWNKAQATKGGIPLTEINPETCESLICPNLYFAGEILDVVGECGGYNLHWAWNTGILVGKAIGNRLSQ